MPSVKELLIINKILGTTVSKAVVKIKKNSQNWLAEEEPNQWLHLPLTPLSITAALTKSYRTGHGGCPVVQHKPHITQSSDITALNQFDTPIKHLLLSRFYSVFSL